MSKAILFLLVLLTSLTMPAVGRAERQIEERFASNHVNGKVEIDLGEGSVQVIGWDRNEVEITGTAGDRVERVEVRKGRRKVWVRGYAPADGEGRATHLIIHAPHSNDIDAQVFNGPITITGIEGDVQVENFSGKVAVTGPCKRVDARTVGGDIVINSDQGATEVDKVRAKSVSGAIVIRGVRREVEVESISGSVEVFGDSLKKVAIESVSGSVRFDGGLSSHGRLDIETHAGDISAALPAELLAEFDLNSFNGHVANAFSPDARENQDFVEGEIDPQAEIRVTSFSGDISVSKQVKGDNQTTVQVTGSLRRVRH